MELLVGKVVCIEGNIAVGKTTLLTSLATEAMNQCISVICIEENIDRTLLEKFNAEPSKYSLQFQEAMMKMRMYGMEYAKKASRPDNIVFLDTGLLREIVFSEANMETGYMTMEEYAEHKNSFNREFERIGKLFPDLIILLDCSVDKCIENIKKRKRINEVKLEREYLEKLRECHLGVTKNSIFGAYTGFIVVDVSDDYPDVKMIVNEITLKYKEDQK